VEASERRCEEPLTRVSAALGAAWREISELLCLYLPTPPHESTGLNTPVTNLRSSE
jgi:hypothetical protein